MSSKKGKITVGFFSALVLMLIIIGSSIKESDFFGIILSVDKDQVIISKTLTPKEYKLLKDISVSQLQKEEMENKRAFLGLISITYNAKHQFVVGDYVDVWVQGGIIESYPEQATARKIKLKTVE